VLFTRAVLDGIAAGSVTLAFRRWDVPQVKAGSRLRTRVGVVGFDEVVQIGPDEVTDEDAMRAGELSRAAVLERFPCRQDRPLWRVRLRLAGPDPRIALRHSAALTAQEFAELDRRLQRLDRFGRHGSWTAVTLKTIQQHPGTRAADLAALLGRETQPFKIDVRKLKELGLTESLDVGYRLSPRGTAYLGLCGDPTPGPRRDDR